jgi:hypothetical protein
MAMAGIRKTDPIEDRKRALMRQAAAKSTQRFSLGGREKEGAHKPRKPSMPALPWDKKEGDADGLE